LPESAIVSLEIRAAPDTVVLVHGIWMTGVELVLLERRLRRCGFRTRRFHYRSLRRSVRHNARELARRLRTLPAERIHLVGHSLGGLVILQALQDEPGLITGRVVLLGSPVNGSAVARGVARQRALRWLMGRATEQGLLGDGPRWRGWQSLGMIAGCRSFGIGRLLGGLSGVNDGVVNLEETRIEGARDSVVVDTTHIGLVVSGLVAAQVCAFLKHGRFDADRAARS
jgi:pimeloyl-ACP methyl ester carboxylesterase